MASLKFKNYIFQLLKIVISISLLAFFVSKVEFDKIFEILRLVNVPPIILILLLAWSSVFISAFRWKVLISPFVPGVSLLYLISLYFKGAFLSTILPGTVGGDIYKIYNIRKLKNDGIELDLSVIFDRFIGLSALIIMSFIAFCFNFKRINNQSVIVLLVSVYLSFFVLTSIYCFLRKRKNESIDKLINFIQRKKYIYRLIEALLSYKNNELAIIKVLILSIIHILYIIFIRYFFIHSINIQISFFYLLFAIPLIFLLTSIPISIQGIGIREGAFLYFFCSIAGLSLNQGLALVFLEYLLLFSSALIGGVLLCFNSDNSIKL